MNKEVGLCPEEGTEDEKRDRNNNKYEVLIAGAKVQFFACFALFVFLHFCFFSLFV